MSWIEYLRARLSPPLPVPTSDHVPGSIIGQSDGSIYSIRIVGPISFFVGPDVLEMAEELIEAQPERVDLYIDSPGGDLFNAVALRSALDIVTERGSRVIAQGGGIVASAAVPIFLAGVERTAREYTRIMVHLPRGLFMGFGTLPDLEKDFADFKRTYAAATGIYRDTIAQVVDAASVDRWLASNTDVWFTATEAETHGFLTVKTSDDPPEPQPAPTGSLRADAQWYRSALQQLYGRR